jgi:aminomethyltransferase
VNQNDLQNLKSTPLTAWHRDHGARMVPYAGYEMPVQYEGVLAEHAAVRERVGLFDITHMGEILATGAGVPAWLDGLTSNRVHNLEIGKVIYTAMCRQDGGVLDDMLIYHLGPDDWMIVCNASNHDKIAAWLFSHAEGVDDVTLEDVSESTALIAVQGPDATNLIHRIESLKSLESDIDNLEFYTCLLHDGPSGRWVISRTGYTGERGYEIYLPAADADGLWTDLMAQGEELGVAPIGLAARDTLRFEVAYCLYGHELAEDVLPHEAGIGWAVRLKNRTFVGSEAIKTMKADGVPRRLMGLEVLAPQAGRPAPIARQDAEIYDGDRLVGRVTSGTKSPTLGRPLALALVATDSHDAELTVDIRGRRVPVRKTSLPFLPARVKGDPWAER